MSGSPKYTSVTVTAARAAAELAERERRTATRLEQEAARHRRQLEAGRRALQKQLDDARDRLDAVRREGLALGDTAILNAIEELEASSADLGRTVAGVTADDIATARRRVKELDRGVQAIRQQLTGAIADSERVTIIQTLMFQLKTTGEDGTTFDAEGRKRAAATTRVLVEAHEAGNQAQFEAAKAEAVAAVEAHLSATEVGRDRQQALDEAKGRLATLEPEVSRALDDAVMFGMTQALEPLMKARQRSAEALSQGDADRAVDEIDQVEKALRESAKHLDEGHIAFMRKVELAEALKSALPESGFQFTGTEAREGAIVMRFGAPNGSTYELDVDDDGEGGTRMTYLIEGIDDRVEIAATGSATCDRTAALLESLHGKVDRAGFQVGALDWKGKPPGREAKLLPGSGGRSLSNEQGR